MVEIVAATTQSPPAYWQAGPNLSTARFQGNVVILPTGELFAIGGTNCLNSNPSDPSQYNLTPELLVNGTSWVAMAPHTGPRHYHSCALLLPDARVFVCGGEQRDVDYQIWEPPYLTNGVRPQDVAVTDSLGQPVSSTARPGMPRGQQFQASWTNMLPPGVVVDRVVLMRPGALTHHDDGGQRCVRLKAWHPEDAEGDNTVTFESPSRHAAPAGWWMLFLLTSAGVPSIAYWVNLP
jgi:hypothetical protein